MEVRIRASFDPLECTANTGTLGAAGPSQAVADFPGAPLPGTWYAVALADQIAGHDLLPATSGHIVAKFNSELGKPGCLEAIHWYYGLDNAHGTDTDLVSVLLHEFAHGLGFLTFVDAGTGSEFLGKPDVFEGLVLDASTGRLWTQMTDAERQASAVNTGAIVWGGSSVRSAVPGTLTGPPTLTVTAPAAIAGDVPIGTASFGAALTREGVSGRLVAATDAANAEGPATTDGCSALDDAAAMSGAVALVDRGTCNFTLKAGNAQAVGAIGVIVVNNVPDPAPLEMGGFDATIAIPAISVTQADGATMRGNLGGGVFVRMRLDPDRLAGADAENRMLLYAPNPVESGSSISHWDTSALPHLLMQPNLAADLPHAVDLTLPLLVDVGWASQPTAPPPPTHPRGPVHGTADDDSPRRVGPRPRGPSAP